MQHFFKLLIIFLFIFISANRAFPIPDNASAQLGSIHGSPVIAIIHGNSDVLKEEIRTKDSEDDPLDSKFGKVVD